MLPIFISMSDALALPFSAAGINNGGYRLIEAFTLRENTKSTPDYDVGCIIGGFCTSDVIIAPIYFIPGQGEIIFPIIRAQNQSQNQFSTVSNRLTIYASSIVAGANTSITAMLFKL